ncbi:hypothetical protein [Rhizobium sp. RCC_161_2]|uniref:hypothetical protein n=1 Tax=Rhizobium sp. RCC_161_2 TaxID=3239219 RepID=UPI00352671F7
MKSVVIRKARKAVWARVVAGIGGLLAATISLGISIYEAGHKDDVVTVAPGTTVNAGRWNVTVDSSDITNQTPDGMHLLDGQKALVVNLTLENLSAQSSNIYFETLKIANIADLPRPQFYLLRDKEMLGDLQPMIPEPISAVWQVPSTMLLPKALDISIVGTKFKPKDNLYAAPGWFDPENVARVELPITGTMP